MFGDQLASLCPIWPQPSTALLMLLASDKAELAFCPGEPRIEFLQVSLLQLGNVSMKSFRERGIWWPILEWLNSSNY